MNSTIYTRESSEQFFTDLGHCLGLELTRLHEHGAAYRVDAYTQIFVRMFGGSKGKAGATLGASHKDSNSIGLYGAQYRAEIGFSASKDIYAITRDIKRRLLDNDIYQSVFDAIKERQDNYFEYTDRVDANRAFLSELGFSGSDYSDRMDLWRDTSTSPRIEVDAATLSIEIKYIQDDALGKIKAILELLGELK